MLCTFVYRHLREVLSHARFPEKGTGISPIMLPCVFFFAEVKMKSIMQGITLGRFLQHGCVVTLGFGWDLMPVAL